MKLSLLKKTLGLSAALLVAGQVQADLITDWNWTLDSAWTGTDPSLGGDSATDVIGSNPIMVGLDQGFATISWGSSYEGGGQSSLVVNNPNLDSDDGGASGAVAFNLQHVGGGVYSDTVDGTLFTHNNITILPPFLTSMTLTDLFTLTADGDVAPSAVANPDFDWLFIETINEDDGDDCFADDPFATPCSDIMVLQDAAPLSFNFAKEGYIYTVTVGAQGLGPLPESACTEAGASTPCIGLITEEDASTPFQFVINLTARKISEPSILALMGLGLFGIGYRRRKNRK